MKQTCSNNILVLLLAIMVIALTFCLQYSCDVAYALNFSLPEIVDSPYYVNRSTISATENYYEYGAKNQQSTYPRQNEYFGFDLGAGVLKSNLNTLVFTFNCLSPKVLNGFNYGNCVVSSFDIFECQREGKTASCIMQVFVISEFVDGGFAHFLYLGRNEFNDARVSVEGCAKGSKNVLSFSTAAGWDGARLLEHQGYEFLASWYGGTCLFPTNTNTMCICIDTTSPYTRYFIRSTADRNYVADSTVVSVYDVLKNKKAINGFDDLAQSKRNEAENIIYNNNIESVRIVYLERIGDTPFATEKSTVVDVPVVEQSIRPSDVASSMGLSSFSVMQSACQYFEYDERFDVYRAYYYKSVWLSAKTADGNNKNYFLDINKSYREYYKENLGNDGIVSNEEYDYYLNRIIFKYPEIETIDDDNLYGYWGWASLPKTKSFSSLIFDVFDSSQANYSGVLDYVQFETSISKSSYKKLLEEYDYSWLEKAWNISVGAFTGYDCYNYIFYCDSGVIEAFIAQNGASSIYDNSSRFGNVVEEAGDNMVEAFKEKRNIILTFVLSIIGAVILLLVIGNVITKSTIASNKKSKSNTAKNKKKSQNTKNKTNTSRTKDVKSQKKKE